MSVSEWPALPYEDWKQTCQTLHLWTQIAGKYRLTQSPWLNHSWHATFYVTSRGLTSSVIPYRSNHFQLDFDFVDHKLLLQTAEGAGETVELKSRSVASFYKEVATRLKTLGIEIRIHGKPNEVEPAIPFLRDEQHASYDPVFVHRFWKILLNVDRVFKQFRAQFIGKCSPVHFFWGSFDLAVTRFSGRTAPEHPGNVPNLPDWVAREAYSHEVCSAGFWPGSEQVPFPLFYSYIYPEPSGYKEAQVEPSDGYYHPDLREFVLPYEAVRTSDDPERTLLEFLRSTYNAAADSARWDRGSLEKNQ